jgi:phage/plasmid-like protein (TIGR03299 family)
MNAPAIYVDRTTTWHSIGKSVEECKDLESVLRASGLDYEVVKEPVLTWPDEDRGGTPITIPNRFVTMRENDKHLYDVVSDKFEIVQNREAFDFVNYMGNDLQFRKAGETEGGMVYIIGALPEVSILGDSFIPHVIFRNGFSGKVKITAAICPLRMVCQNQFNFAFKNTQNTVTIRHVRNAHDKLEEAREVLKVSADYMQELNAMAEQYASIKLSATQLDKVMDWMFPMENADQMNSFKRHQLEAQREKFRNAYLADDNANFHGTAWGLINAYTDLITHRKPMGKSSTKEEGKFMAVTFHPGVMNAILNAMTAVGIAA